MTVPRGRVARSGPAGGVCLEGCEPSVMGLTGGHWDYFVSAPDPQKCELGDLFPLAWDHTVPCHDEQFLQSIAKKHKSPTDIPEVASCWVFADGGKESNLAQQLMLAQAVWCLHDHSGVILLKAEHSSKWHLVSMGG